MSNISVTTLKNEFSIRLYPTTSFLVASYTLITIAILLNGIEIKLILRKIKRATDFEILLLNLAIADLFNSFLLVSAIVITQQSSKAKEKIRYSGTFHWIMGTLAFSVTASASFVAAIGIERFFAIKLPLQHRLWHTKRKRLVKCVLLTWLFDVIAMTSLSLTDYLRVRKNPNSISATVSYCAAGILTFGTVLVIVVYTWVLYMMILRSLKLFNFDQNELRIDKNKIKEAMKKEKSSIIICILVVVSFMVCNLPLVIDLFQLQITKASAIFLKVSGVLNPLIYFFKSYIERYYGKRKLVLLCEEKNNSKQNGSRSQESNDMAGKGHGSEVIVQKEQVLAKEDVTIGVIENVTAIEEDSGKEDKVIE